MTTTATEPRSEAPAPAPRRRQTRPVLTVVAALVAVLLVAELGARVLLERFVDPPDGWNLRQMHAQVAAMERMGEAGGAEVLLLGSSVVGAALDPDLLAERSSRYDRAFTLWLPGAPVRSMEVLYDQVAEPLLSPRVVVIGLTARELNANGNGQERSVQSLVTSPELRRLAGTESPLQRADRWFGDVSALVRLRSTLRDPGRLELALRIGKQEGDGSLPEPWNEDRPVYEERAEHVDQERRALRNYRSDGVELDALRRLVDAVREDGGRVVLVNMPVNIPDYDPLFPDGAADRLDYEATFDRVCGELAAECLDAAAAETWTEADFSNVNHTSTIGTERMTTLVAEALDAAP